MTLLQKSGFLIACALLLSATGITQEIKIKYSDLPAAVARTVDAQGSGATVQGFSKENEKGKTYYEAALTVNGHSKDILMDSSGAIVEIEEEVLFDSLPATVQKGLLAKSGQGHIRKVESLTKRGELVAYEAQVQQKGKTREIQVGPDGSSLRRKE